MAYQENYPTRTHDGSTLIPISVEKEVLEIRKAIEQNEAHAGRNYEIVYQAYKEIKNATGKVAKEKKRSAGCTSCVREMNLLLNNWLKMYDSRLFDNVIVTPPKTKPLVPKIETKEPSYKELLEKFTAVATTEQKRTINNGNTPKKAQLIEFFTPKQDQDEQE